MTSKFKVGDKVRFLEDFGSYRKGDVVEIVNKNVYCGEQTVDFKGKNGNGNTYITRIELVSNKQRIAVLESELSEVKNALAEQIKWNDEQKRVNDTVLKKLRLLFDNANQVKPSTVVEEALTAATSVEDIIEFEGDQYKKVDREAREGDVVILKEPARGNATIELHTPYKVMLDGRKALCIKDPIDAHLYSSTFGRTPETVDVYELIVEDKQNDGPPYAPFGYEPKTANQLRAEIIEKAKVFVEKRKNIRGRYEIEDRLFKPFECNVEFVVDVEKRTIVALMKGFQSRDLYAKGIAKCMPGDVFNEHIGKAIALGRALGLDVGEFEQAAQPTLTVGQIVTFESVESKSNFTVKKLIENPNPIKFPGQAFRFVGSCSWLSESQVQIINDTNAIYGSVE